MHHILNLIIPIATNFLELVGVVVILIGSVESIVKLVLTRFSLDDINIKLKLAKALELGLEFKLAAEILKTVLIHTIDELLILSSVVILRVIMTFVIHWEIKKGEKEKECTV